MKYMQLQLLLVVLAATSVVVTAARSKTVAYDVVQADYLQDGVKAFVHEDVQWYIYNDTKTGLAYFYNAENGKVQWSDPRPELQHSWREAWHVVLACWLVPPLLFVIALSVRVWYLQETTPELLHPTKERKERKQHWPRRMMKPPGNFRKSGRPTK